MRRILLPILLIIVLSVPYTYSQSSGQNLFPMSVGNVYVYSVNSHSGGGYDTTYLRRGTIDRDSLIDGRKYYFINSIKFNGWYRVDTATGSLYKYDSVGSCSHYINEILIDSLSSSPGGLNYSCIPGQSAIVICSFENRELFGQNIFHKKFSYSYNVGPATFTYNSYYASGYGLSTYVTYYSNFISGTVTHTLKGCVINGVVYGDTTVTSILQIGNTVPSSFSLHQNYPNPFNPSTKIKFGIPKGALVKLKIYDILGREVAVLVNEKLTAGIYEYDWNASALPSGVYFYRLEAGEFTESKRMVLVK